MAYQPNYYFRVHIWLITIGKNHMGMASSQARLLTLTARMHQIEYKAARIEAQKLQLANDTRRVYEDYLDALDMSKIEAGKMDYNFAPY